MFISHINNTIQQITEMEMDCRRKMKGQSKSEYWTWFDSITDDHGIPDYSDETGYEKSLHLKEILASSPGIREAYRISTIRQQLDIESVKILDEIVRKIDEEY